MLVHFVFLETVTHLEIQDQQFQQEALTDWQTNGTGPLSNPATDFLAFEKVPADLRQNFSSDVLQALDSFSSDWPELEASISHFNF